MCPVDHQAITGSTAAANAAAPSMPLFRPSHGKSALEIAKSVADITTGQVDASTSAVCPSLVRTRGVVMRQEFELPLRLADGKGFPVPHALAAQQLDVTVVVSSGGCRGRAAAATTISGHGDRDAATDVAADSSLPRRLLRLVS